MGKQTEGSRVSSQKESDGVMMQIMCVCIDYETVRYETVTENVLRDKIKNQTLHPHVRAAQY